MTAAGINVEHVLPEHSDSNGNSIGPDTDPTNVTVKEENANTKRADSLPDLPSGLTEVGDTEVTVVLTVLIKE